MKARKGETMKFMIAWKIPPQVPLDRLLGHQPDRPAGLPFWWCAADVKLGTTAHEETFALTYKGWCWRRLLLNNFRFADSALNSSCRHGF